MLYNTLVVTREDLSYIVIMYFTVGNLTYLIPMKKITNVLIVFTYLYYYIDNNFILLLFIFSTYI